MVIKDFKSLKDLEITISKDLTCCEHISTIVNKANQVLGLTRRTIGTANTKTFLLLYKTSVRPLLEYAAPVLHSISCQRYSCNRECAKTRVKVGP